MRLLVFVLLVALGGACVSPTEPRCFAVGADTVGVLMYQTKENPGVVSSCVWLTNDKAYCQRSQSAKPRCAVGRPIKEFV